MTLFIFRLLMLIGLIAVVYLIIKRLFQPTDSVPCSRCDGMGYWYGTRGKETCDWCKGSGKLPKGFNKI